MPPTKRPRIDAPIETSGSNGCVTLQRMPAFGDRWLARKCRTVDDEAEADVLLMEFYNGCIARELRPYCALFFDVVQYRAGPICYDHDYTDPVSIHAAFAEILPHLDHEELIMETFDADATTCTLYDFCGTAHAATYRHVAAAQICAFLTWMLSEFAALFRHNDLDARNIYLDLLHNDFAQEPHTWSYLRYQYTDADGACHEWLVPARVKIIDLARALFRTTRGSAFRHFLDVTQMPMPALIEQANIAFTVERITFADFKWLWVIAALHPTFASALRPFCIPCARSSSGRRVLVPFHKQMKTAEYGKQVSAAFRNLAPPPTHPTILEDIPQRRWPNTLTILRSMRPPTYSAHWFYQVEPDKPKRAAASSDTSPNT